MTDTTEQSLYKAREPIFPKRVSGRFRSLKWAIMIVTLGIYYLVPWIRWDRGPSLPDQAVLIDLAGRRFYFFWIEIWPHEFYFVAGLLIMAGLGLFLFTSALGRVWCGYACPQTVWTDLFLLVERRIEGDRNAQLRLHRQKMDLRKARLRLTKWALWLLIGLVTGGAWVFYFADAPTLLRALVTGEAHPVAYVTVAILTLTTFVFGGFAREQICIYACPWPRIQAAMMDEDTLTVGYRFWRGEPRGKGNARRKPRNKVLSLEIAAEEAVTGRAAPAYPSTPMPHAPPRAATPAKDRPPGDCIDCMACVNVCPMGIDIRNGQQMECITCALCIDACDDVMARIGKPRGLIDYMALTDEAAERAGEPPKPIWQQVFRPRTVLYTALWAGVGLALLVALFIRPEIDMTVAPVRNPTFVTLSDGAIRNTYEVRLRNKHGSAQPFRLSVAGDPTLLLEVEGAAGPTVTVPADATRLHKIYVIAPAGSAAAGQARTAIRLWVEDTESGERSFEDTVFNGKES
ncbi:cytochrome c oxidase accessory protein CcoG [Marinovum sp.]|uniref:RdxA/RdxB/FixG family protein n=1 Tax=Marinovum sp. TaxID=2024839 RepID=UPI002B26FE20|nr:cytochrome c oxidase accessory protein CcoG [Marinovum sp.]